MSFKIDDNTEKFINENRQAIVMAFGRAAKDVLKISNIKVPFKDGDLQKSGRVDKKGEFAHRIVYDIEYAAYQERGKRADGSRVVRRYSTPGTGKGYLRSAGEEVVKNGVNYIKQAINLMRL